MINCIEYMQKRIVLACCIAAFATFGPGLMCCAAEADAEKPSWEMVKGNMVTRWAKEVSPTNALPEYRRPMIYMGLSGAVYTQITEIENELNGLMTYDRELLKMDARQITAVNLELYDPPPVVKTILATSQQTPQIWRYTTTKPGKDWHKPDFDDSAPDPLR